MILLCFKKYRYLTSSFERPAFQNLFRELEQGTINCVLVKDLSRFGRNYIEVGRYLERIFPVMRVRLIAVTDNYDSQSAWKTSDSIMVPMRNLLNDAYCRDISVKPAVSIKYGVMKFNMACIRLFEGIKYVLPILHPNKKRLALIMCPEEDSASVEWARQKGENWVNKDITSLEFVENIFRLMNWNRECRYKVLGRVANSDQGLCMLFDLEEAIMFTPKPQEYTDPLTGEMKKKQMKFFPDAYKNRIGKSYNDYIADHQMNMFEDFIGYQGSTVLDEPEREAGTTSIPIPQREESENIPLPDLPGQLENVQQSGNEIAERGMPT